MKRNLVIAGIACFVFALVAVISLDTQGYTYDTLEKLFNRMVESSADDNSIKVEFVNTVSDFSVHNETALTDTVDPTFQIRHTTTGTPANGIGLSMDYKQETSASNEEIIARATSLMTDVTAASEDADYILSLMDAGATAAERWRLDSGGVITQSGTSAATNTVVDLVSTKHNTSGIAAAGIGIGQIFTQETAAGNDEVIGSIDFVTTDVTNASEDADFVLSLMDAGAAAAEVLRVTSDGVLTLEGAATIDNATSATNLAIAETNIGLTGILTVTGATTITGAATINGAVVINETSADVDTRIESNGNDSAIFVNAGDDRVGILTAAPSVPFEVTGASLFTGAVSITGDVTLGGALDLKTCTIADGDATPSVAGCTVLTTVSNTGPTEITDLDNPVVGAIYVIIGGNATNSSTITDGGNFALSAGWTATVDETLTLFVQADNDYIELTRSTN